MAGEIGILFRKEWRQLLRSKGATASALLLPLLLLIVIPVPQILGLSKVGGVPSNLPPGVKLPPGLESIVHDPKSMPVVLMPLFVMLAGLIVPMLAASYTLITERETRTLELLVALPVTIGQVLWAKLGALLLMSTGVTIALLSVDICLLLATGTGSVAFALSLPVLLVSSIAFSACGAFLISLLARDFRTANNLSGALILPALLVTMGILALVSNHALAVWTIAVALGLGGAVVLFLAMRVVTFERLLS